MTTARSTLASVRKELTIKASQARAFRTFTELIDEWWPRSHHIGKVELKKAVLEPRQGGRWYEIGVDGSECNWGRTALVAPELEADGRYETLPGRFTTYIILPRLREYS